MKKTLNERTALANHEIVTLAVYLLGGETQRADTEDIAVKANELVPGRFTCGNIATLRLWWTSGGACQGLWRR